VGIGIVAPIAVGAEDDRSRAGRAVIEGQDHAPAFTSQGRGEESRV
jgi:hypothetical protein